jgi:hypothetical protein
VHTQTSPARRFFFRDYIVILLFGVSIQISIDSSIHSRPRIVREPAPEIDDEPTSQIRLGSNPGNLTELSSVLSVATSSFQAFQCSGYEERQ